MSRDDDTALAIMKALAATRENTSVLEEVVSEHGSPCESCGRDCSVQSIKSFPVLFRVREDARNGIGPWMTICLECVHGIVMAARGAL